MKKRKRIEVGIQSREYWFKSNEPIENYWALIDKEHKDDIYTIFFMIHKSLGKGLELESIIFDRLYFNSREDAVKGLKRNHFLRVDEFHSIFLPENPPPPFIEWNFMKLFSRQGLWK